MCVVLGAQYRMPVPIFDTSGRLKFVFKNLVSIKTTLLILQRLPCLQTLNRSNTYRIFMLRLLPSQLLPAIRQVLLSRIAFQYITLGKKDDFGISYIIFLALEVIQPLLRSCYQISLRIDWYLFDLWLPFR